MNPIDATRTSRRGRSPVRRAFTVIELIAVTLIIVILIGIAVPAFSGLLYSAEASSAQTQLASALRVARDAAVQQGEGSDAAAVFTLDRGGRLTVVICQQAGTITDRDFAGDAAARDVFVPVGRFEPIQLPRNWMVRGFAAPGAVDLDWYGDSGRDSDSEYDGSSENPPLGDWVLPETDFYDRDYDNPSRDGRNRQTFMVRFAGGSGQLIEGRGASLVLLPRPSDLNRPNGWQRVDRAPDLVRWTSRVLQDASLSEADRRDLLGDVSGDTALARSVAQLALYDETRLASAAGVRTDRATGVLYRAEDEPRFVEGISAEQIRRWIEGDTNFNNVPPRGGAPDEDDEPQARIYLVDRFTGQVREVDVQVVE